MELKIINRFEQLKRFVDNHFSNIKYTIKPIVGDAGLRDYLRVSTDDKSYIIMDCPPSYTSIEPFIQIAEFLTQNGFSAPKIVKSDIDRGFLILQDFGKLSVKNYLINDNKTQRDIYHLSIDLLIKLQNIEPPKNLKTFNNALLISELSIFTDYYAPYKHNQEIASSDIESFNILWQELLLKQCPIQNSIVLRDYHVENMMYLKHKKGINKLGLLDFQDALIGSPLYDLVSILEDARIDISRDFALECVQYYASEKRIDLEDALINYHILGAQRNLRILGIFARKYIRDKDDTYLQYIPRVLKYLEYDVSHPVLEPIKNWLLKIQII